MQHLSPSSSIHLHTTALFKSCLSLGVGYSRTRANTFELDYQISSAPHTESPYGIDYEECRLAIGRKFDFQIERSDNKAVSVNGP